MELNNGKENQMKTKSIYISKAQAELIKEHCGWLPLGLTQDASNIFTGQRGSNRLAVSVWEAIASTLHNRIQFLNAQASDLVNLQWETGQSLSGTTFREMTVEVIACQKLLRVIAKAVGEPQSQYEDSYGLDNISSDEMQNNWFFTLPGPTKENAPEYWEHLPEWVGDWAFTK